MQPKNPIIPPKMGRPFLLTYRTDRAKNRFAENHKPCFSSIQHLQAWGNTDNIITGAICIGWNFHFDKKKNILLYLLVCLQ